MDLVATFHFTAPAMLLGLIAIGLPILIHMWHLQSGPPTWFSNLRMIEQVWESHRQRHRVQQRVLLAIRILIITCLVFAFSGIRWEKDQAEARSADNNAPHLHILIIDASASMQRISNGQSLFSEAIEQASYKIMAARAKNQFYILHAGKTITPALKSPSNDKAALLAQLNAWQASSAYTSLPQAFSIAEFNLSNSQDIQNFNSHASLHLFTDTTEGNWPQGSPAGFNLFSNSPSLTLHAIGQKLPTNNLAIQRIDLATSQLLAGQNSTINISIHNYASTEQSTDLTINIAGQSSSTPVTIAANTSKQVSFPIQITDPGLLYIQASIADDAWHIDNSMSLFHKVKDKFTLHATFTKNITEERLLHFLFMPNDDSPFKWAEKASMAEIDIHTSISKPINDNKLNAIFPTDNAAELISHLEKLGINAKWKTLPSPLLIKITNTSDRPFDRFTGASLNTVQQLSFKRRLQITSQSENIAYSTLLRFSDDSPACIRVNGQLIWLAPIDLTHSNLLQSAAGLPLLHELLLMHLSLPYQLPQASNTNKVNQGNENLQLLGPNGNPVAFQRQTNGNDATYFPTRSTEIGTYQLYDDDQLIGGLHLSLDPRESNLQHQTQFNLSNHADTNQITTATPAAGSTKKHTPLWAWCMILAALLFLPELWLSLKRNNEQLEVKA